MTTATLNALRTIAQTVNAPEITMTAREMALTPHNLNRSGNRAMMVSVGQVWHWSDTRELWILSTVL